MPRKAKNNKQDIVELYKAISESLVNFIKAFIVSKPLKPAKFHYWLSDVLLKHKFNVAIEGFRESGKTSFVVYAYPLYCLTFPHPDRSYIVFLKASDEQAKQRLHDIRDMYFNNKLMSANIQYVYSQGDVLDVLTKEGIRIRMEAYGKGANIRGLTWMSRRPDIVILDDVQTVEDVRSQTVSDRDWEWFLSDVYMLSKVSRIFMIGNNLGDRCILERLSRNATSFGFKFYRIPAIKDGNPTWAAKFSIEELNAERKAYQEAGKLDVWMRERMCQSISEETQIFKKSYFQYYDRLPKGQYNRFIAVDLAISQKSTADYTAMTVLAVNNQNQRFIEDIDFGRYDVNTIIEHLFELVIKYRPVKVFVEKVAFQAVMEQLIRKEMLKRNVFFQLEMVQPKGKKEDRIRSLQPYYAAHSIWHKKDAPYLTELENELIMFTDTGTKAEHDDLIDSLEMVNRYAFPPMLGAVKGNLQTKAKYI